MSTCNANRGLPVTQNPKRGSDGDPVSMIQLYIGVLQGLHNLPFTRPNISYAGVQQIGLHMHTLRRTPSFAALKRFFRYILSTLDHGHQLMYRLHLQPDNLLSWSAKRQVTLSRSSSEAEYRGVANVVAETNLDP
ncbi:ribonuclease H-like domain-containing protein [Tanacetum coccineum]